jgi:acetylornithine/N-succinyldiaminopimelate aminotransferase
LAAGISPLIPGNELVHFNDPDCISRITDSTAAVIMEPVQAEAGIILPAADFLQQIRKRCTENRYAAYS